MAHTSSVTSRKGQGWSQASVFPLTGSCPCRQTSSLALGILFPLTDLKSVLTAQFFFQRSVAGAPQ
eukprot:scaffold227573_cov17-Tisochrysis_lutea.AAC.1